MSEEMISTVKAREIAEEAARSALASFFKFLDIDLDNHDDIRALRDDLAYMRRQREGTDALKKKINNAAWSVLPVVIIGWLAWIGGVFSDGFRRALLDFLGK